jgi:hypothetical protein
MHAVYCIDYSFRHLYLYRVLMAKKLSSYCQVLFSTVLSTRDMDNEYRSVITVLEVSRLNWDSRMSAWLIKPPEIAIPLCLFFLYCLTDSCLPKLVAEEEWTGAPLACAYLRMLVLT